MLLEVHEEVLRLLLAVHSKLSVQQVADYLQTLLRNSRKSRRWVAIPLCLLTCKWDTLQESILASSCCVSDLKESATWWLQNQGLSHPALGCCRQL